MEGKVTNLLLFREASKKSLLFSKKNLFFSIKKYLLGLYIQLCTRNTMLEEESKHLVY